MVRDEIPVAHQRHVDLGLVALVGHGDVEIANMGADIGDDRGDLRAAVEREAVVDIDPHRAVIFADTVDAAGDMEFGAEGNLEEAVDDLGVGEILALDRAAVSDLDILARRGCDAEAARRHDQRQT